MIKQGVVKMSKSIAATFLLNEFDRANRIYGVTVTSPHEGYAVLLDELWTEIKKKHRDKVRMREEVTQVRAMAIKFIESTDRWTSMDMCRRCVFVVMTTEDLAEVGDDPCETCNSDFCNWKGRC